MKAPIKIPSPLRRFTAGFAEVELEADTVAEALNQLFLKYPEIRPQIMNDQGQLRNFVNLFHNKVDIRQQQGLETPLQQGSELRIVPAIAGGSEVATSLSAAELSRYSRHLMLPEVGIDGQEALKAARVLIVGAGGLGCPLGLYLAAAGVGQLGLVDDDVVDDSNLQRQILFTVGDIGAAKVKCAQSHLQQLNPHIKINRHQLHLSAQNALEIIDQYDLVIDGTDNFPTRYLVNDACILLNKTNIYGSIFRFEGQATVFNYQQGPCYRCLYPEPPPPGLVPSCAEGGVLGVLPGIIASIQATEAIKIITRIGIPLSGRLLLYDALRMEFDQLQIDKNPDCPLCGEQPSITSLIDYQQFCGLTTPELDIAYEEISPQGLKQRLDAGAPFTLIDVREPFERAICRIHGSQHIPMAQIADCMSQFQPDQQLVFYCKMGGRSAKVCQQFVELGFKNVTNLKGGILAWADEIDNSLTRY
ncbi:MAG: molybdopterin-synthase adenylyltransferase MoeB [Amphritea sp.]